MAEAESPKKAPGFLKGGHRSPQREDPNSDPNLDPILSLGVRLRKGWIQLLDPFLDPWFFGCGSGFWILLTWIRHLLGIAWYDVRDSAGSKRTESIDNGGRRIEEALLIR